MLNKISLITVLIFIFTSLLYSQQTNYTFGQKTDGTEYTEAGLANVDSTDTYSFVIDFQDYYRAADDVYGVFWVYFDAQNSTDTTVYWINFRNGGMSYHPNNTSRVATANLSWSADTTAIQAADTLVGDHIWKKYEITVSAQMLPPAFGRIDIKFDQTISRDSLDIRSYFGYQATYETEQSQRKVDRDVRNPGSRKDPETLE